MIRPIDANALEKEGWSLHRTVNVDSHTMEYQRKPIADFPTIEPERTGKWIKEKNRGQLYQCSACGNYLDFRGVNAGRGSANYCPNCGARMEIDG